MAAQSAAWSRQTPSWCKEQGGAACSECRSRVIARSLAFNVVGCVLKVVVGLVCGSQAIVADAVHSLSDSVASGFVFVGDRWKPDAASSAVFNPGDRVAAVFFLSGIWICCSSVTSLIVGSARPGLFALAVAVVSLPANWYLRKVSACASKKYDDAGIYLCKVQNRTNFVTAVLSLVGVLLADLGLVFCDALVAVIIGAVLVGSGAEVFTQTRAGQSAAARRTALSIVAALSLGIAGYFVYGYVARTDIVLIPAQGATTASPVDSLLGRGHYFLILDTKKHTYKPIQNEARRYEGDVSENLLAIIKTNDVDVVVARKIGAEAYSDLRAKKVRMYYVETPGTVSEALLDYKRGKLSVATAPNVGKGYGRSNVRWLSPW
jgi:predicted Fe-Mo cluster-binding NifX family protein